VVPCLNPDELDMDIKRKQAEIAELTLRVDMAKEEEEKREKKANKEQNEAAIKEEKEKAQKVLLYPPGLHINESQSPSSERVSKQNDQRYLTNQAVQANQAVSDKAYKNRKKLEVAAELEATRKAALERVPTAGGNLQLYLFL